MAALTTLSILSPVLSCGSGLMVRQCQKLKQVYRVSWSVTERMSSYQNLRDMRAKYLEAHEAFTENQLVSREDPFVQFKAWFDEAKTTKEIIEPTAVCLATATKDGIPSARMVLLKGYGPEGFQFFTHYTSRKGKELEQNSKAALLFYWDILHKQVIVIRMEGEVLKLPIEEAEKYFKSRPVPSQIGSAASNQSCIIPNRDYLLEKAKDLEKSNHSKGQFDGYLAEYMWRRANPDRFHAFIGAVTTIQSSGNAVILFEEVGEVDRPPLWGGYLFVPNLFEFWQGQSDRLHDRICFKRNETGWQCYRLAP